MIRIAQGEALRFTGDLTASNARRSVPLIVALGEICLRTGSRSSRGLAPRCFVLLANNLPLGPAIPIESRCTGLLFSALPMDEIACLALQIGSPGLDLGLK